MSHFLRPLLSRAGATSALVNERTGSVIAAVLEADFLQRGVHLLKGARAVSIERVDDSVVVRCDDGRIVNSSHAVLAIGSIPNSDGLGLDAAGVEVDDDAAGGRTDARIRANADADAGADPVTVRGLVRVGGEAQ